MMLTTSRDTQLACPKGICCRRRSCWALGLWLVGPTPGIARGQVKGLHRRGRALQALDPRRSSATGVGGFRRALWAPICTWGGAIRRFCQGAIFEGRQEQRENEGAQEGRGLHTQPHNLGFKRWLVPGRCHVPQRGDCQQPGARMARRHGIRRAAWLQLGECTLGWHALELQEARQVLERAPQP